MGSPWRLCEEFATSSRALRENVAGAGGFEKRPRSLREAFSKASPVPTEASWSLLEGFARRSWRLHLETIRQIMTSPPISSQLQSVDLLTVKTKFWGGRLGGRLAERLVAELRGGRKVTVYARSNVVPLSALCCLHQFSAKL